MDEQQLKIFCLKTARIIMQGRSYEEVLKNAKQLYREITERPWSTPPQGSPS